MIEKDVVIIGAGPAGSSAAYFLAGLGLDVTLLESKKLPRTKPCGDGIGPRAVLMLHRLGLADWLENQNFYRIYYMRLISPSGNSIVSETSGYNFPIDYGYVIRRDALDFRLVRHAASAGADLLEEFYAETCFFDDDGRPAGVVGAHQGEQVKIKAKLIVAADGSTGGFTRRFGSTTAKTHAIGYRGYAAFPFELDNCVNIFFSGLLPKGYGWVFPLSKKSANIGVGSLGVKKEKISLKQAFSEFIQTTETPFNLKEAELEQERQGSIMRMDFDSQPLALPGVVFIGDAAGLVSPINGEGISHAMESAYILAEALKDNFNSYHSIDRALGLYKREMRRVFNSYFRWARFLGRLLSNQQRLDKLIQKAENDSVLSHMLTGIISNTVHPRELGRLRIIRRMLW